MKFTQRMTVGIALAILSLAWAGTRAEPLPSWKDGATRTAIMDFVAAVSNPESADFVPPAELIAVFDNDGCL